MRKGTVRDTVNRPGAMVIHLKNTSTIYLLKPKSRVNLVQDEFSPLARFAMMSSWRFPNLTASTPPPRLDLDIVVIRRQVPLLTPLSLPIRRDIAWLGETCSEIADPYAQQRSIEHEGLPRPQRRRFDQMKADLRAVAEKTD